ncbi:MAG TPA: hypothetical protein VD998_03715 [Verrucomicrobiae bacterium]|nr:hypothetical protein [Verrucomicrobiae bacterium]
MIGSERIELDRPVVLTESADMEVRRVLDRFPDGKTVFLEIPGVTEDTRYIPASEETVGADRIIVRRGAHFMIFERPNFVEVDHEEAIGDVLQALRGFHLMEKIYASTHSFSDAEISRVMELISDDGGKTVFLGVDEITVDGRFIPKSAVQEDAQRIVLRVGTNLMIFNRQGDRFKFFAGV